MKKYKYILLALAFIFSVTMLVNAGVNDRFSDIDLTEGNYIEGPEITAPGAPVDGRWRIYSVADVPYFVSDGQVAISMISASTAYDDIGNPDANSSISFTTFTNTWTGAQVAGDGYNFLNTGNFGDISLMRISQETGNPTDGTVLEVIAADANVDPLVVSASTTARALVVGQNTGVVTIAGVADGTTALEIALGDINLTDGDVNVVAGDATFGEDVSITGNLIGGTGLINYTHFDVDATGAITNVGAITSDGDITTTTNLIAVDGTFSGNMSVTGTFQQDALSAATADTTITLDGTGTGGVSIGTAAGTGAITLGGSATAVTLPATVDLTLAGGDLTITDTANADTVQVTNNTMTTADLFQLTTGGTRTSGNVIKIVDSSTTAASIGITADAITTGNVIHVQADALEAGGAMLYLDSDAIPDTNTFYIEAVGTGTDYTLAKDGVAVHSGVASTDVITVTTGDVQIDDGLLEIDTDEDDTTKIERAQATVTGPVVSIVEQTHTAASAQAALFIDQDTTSDTSWGIQIDSEGATGLDFVDLVAAGNGITFSTAASYTGQLISVNDTLVGTNGEGIIDIKTTGNMATGSTLLRLDADTGTLAGATDGFLLSADDDSVAVATSYAVKIDSASNEALHVATGLSLFDEIATFTAGITSNGNTILGNAATDNLTVGAAFVGAGPIILDGATDNAAEITITLTDPTTDKNFNIPDSNVNMEAMTSIGVGLTTYTESAAATEVITEATVAIAAGHAAAGQVYTWEVSGVKTGANDTYAIILVLDGTTALTLTASDATAATFNARVTCIMVDSGNSLVYGELLENGKVTVQGRATVVDDLSGAVNIGLSMTLANAGDEVSVYNTLVTYNE